MRHGRGVFLSTPTSTSDRITICQKAQAVYTGLRLQKPALTSLALPHISQKRQDSMSQCISVSVGGLGRARGTPLLPLFLAGGTRFVSASLSLVAPEQLRYDGFGVNFALHYCVFAFGNRRHRVYCAANSVCHPLGSEGAEGGRVRAPVPEVLWLRKWLVSFRGGVKRVFAQRLIGVRWSTFAIVPLIRKRAYNSCGPLLMGHVVGGPFRGGGCSHVLRGSA